MTVSIIICTRDRAESLRLTLESIGEALVPPGWTVELLVVDNGSTDPTPAVIRSARLSNVVLRHVHEAKAGLSYARNTGLRETSGEVILFTDDDIRVPLHWMEGMCRPILEGKADAIAGGVRFPPAITAVLAHPPFSLRRSWYASTEELDRNAPARMVGANMAFHRRVLDRVPGFDVELGAGALGFHDETLFSSQLLAAGYRLISALDVAVEHHLDLARLTEKGTLDLARKMGRSNAFVFHHWEHQKSRFTLPWLALCHLYQMGRQGLDRIKGKSVPRISALTLQVEQDMAFYREYLVQRRRPCKYPVRNPANLSPQRRPCFPGHKDRGADISISIIICTRNRAGSLAPMLESIGNAIVPPGWNVELLVIDNGSTDTTGATVAAMTLPNLPIRYLKEQRVGKGYAYCAGMAAARGEIFLFTDDDVRVPCNWIEGMCRPLLEGRADAVAGGVVFPPNIEQALTQPPFSARRSWFASTEELDREAPTRMVGANMAFHRHVLDRVPGFEVELGPGALGFHDETLFSWELLAAGFKIVSAFDVVVEHHIDPARLTREGMIDLAHKMGRSHAFVFYHWEHKRSRLAFPWLVLAHLCRPWTGCLDRISRHNACGISIPTLRVEQNLAFYREYIAQRRRRRKYVTRRLAPKAARTVLYSS